MPLDLPDAARMKVHLRILPLAGRLFRVVTLRPSARARFSTNYYHATWHIVSDSAGAKILARLMWGLAFQKQPNTLVLIHDPHLVPTPFDGARSDPVVLIPSGLTPVCEDALHQLKARLRRLGPSTQTIRWHSFGLDLEMAQDEADIDTELHEQLFRSHTMPGDSVWSAEQMSRIGGVICYTAPPLVLRAQALIVAKMQTRSREYAPMDYHYLAREGSASWGADGEVQIFHDYRDRVRAATLARREVLAGEDAPADPETLEEVISRRRNEIRHRRRNEE